MYLLNSARRDLRLCIEKELERQREKESCSVGVREAQLSRG